jgi:hypothetical protein
MSRKYKMFRTILSSSLLGISLLSLVMITASPVSAATPDNCDQPVCLLTCKDGTTLNYDKVHDPLSTDQECADHGGAKSVSNNCTEEDQDCSNQPNQQETVGKPIGPGVGAIDIGSLPGAGSNNTNASTIQTILQIVFGIAGALALLVITIAGFRYVLSAGDPQAIANAKNAIIYALIGLLIAIFAEALVSFIAGSL